MDEKRKFMRYFFSWPVIYIYSSFIIVISFLPVKVSPELLFPFQDKIIHGLIYWLLSFLAVNIFFRKKISRFKLRALFFAFFLGLFIEIGQHFLPFRSFEAGDIFANLLGSVLGCLLLV